MKQAYREINLKPSSLAVVEIANTIVTEYQEKGYLLSLRQLYYRFVAGGFIPNKDTEYKRLGSIISDARYAGLIDWDAIEDRTRNLGAWEHFLDPNAAVSSVAGWYALDKWEDQPRRVEVWVEKEALAGIVSRVAQDLDVSYMACRGYMSASEMRVAAMRFCRYEREGQETVLLHLGDHDPSGIDMTRDIEDRLREFCECHGCAGPQVERIALNMDQVEAYDPPANPAKVTDSRARSYLESFGDESWELDALPPDDLADLIRRHVEANRHEELWEEAEAREERERRHLTAAASHWERVATFLEEEGLVEEE